MFHLQRTELDSLHLPTFPQLTVHTKRRFSKSFPISYCQLHLTHRGKLLFESFPITNSLQTHGRQFLSHSSHLGPVYLKLDNQHFTTITGYDAPGDAFPLTHLLSNSFSPFNSSLKTFSLCSGVLCFSSKPWELGLSLTSPFGLMNWLHIYLALLIISNSP